MSRDFIKEIKKAVVALDQNNLFGGGDENAVIKLCIEYLRFNGYTVVNPKIFSREIKSTEHLVDYFYELLNKKYVGNYMTSYNKIKDLSIAKQFIESRMAVTGASREHCLSECGEIVKTIFENEEVFKFNREISFYIFGQAKLKWITDKALEIMNSKLKKKEEVREEMLRQKMIDADDVSGLGFTDLDEILASMEEDNG